MTDITNRTSITVDEFRAWLNQLIADKKGALPDLNDWKVIKEQLDKVGRHDDSNGPGYSIFGDDCDPYDLGYHLNYLDQLNEEVERHLDGQINQFYDEYIRTQDYNNGKTKTESDTSSTSSYFGTR